MEAEIMKLAQKTLADMRTEIIHDGDTCCPTCGQTGSNVRKLAEAVLDAAWDLYNLGIALQEKSSSPRDVQEGMNHVGKV